MGWLTHISAGRYNNNAVDIVNDSPVLKAVIEDKTSTPLTGGLEDKASTPLGRGLGDGASTPFLEELHAISDNPARQ